MDASNTAKVQKEMKMTTYSIKHEALDCNTGLTLKAKTDLGARREAKKIAKREGLRGYIICFFRTEDGCRGTIEN